VKLPKRLSSRLPVARPASSRATARAKRVRNRAVLVGRRSVPNRARATPLRADSPIGGRRLGAIRGRCPSHVRTGALSRARHGLRGEAPSSDARVWKLGRPGADAAHEVHGSTGCTRRVRGTASRLWCCTGPERLLNEAWQRPLPVRRGRLQRPRQVLPYGADEHGLGRASRDVVALQRWRRSRPGRHHASRQSGRPRARPLGPAMARLSEHRSCNRAIERSRPLARPRAAQSARQRLQTSSR
jgi:hypothetical protein